MQNINVNIVPDSYPQTIRYSQGDVGREFKINVVGFTIPTGATVKIQATKPSGFGFSVAGTVSGNAVSFTTTAIMTDEAGRFPAELEITKDSVVIGTANFIMWGEANPHPEGTTDGQQGTIIPELTLLVERVEAAASSVLDMEVVANTLPAGSQATYSYDEDLNKATFGIPQGEAGAGAAGVVASAYSASATYKVGDYVIHNSNLYRCTTAITTAEAFTAAHWTQIVLADDVSDLKTDLDELDEYLEYTFYGKNLIDYNDLTDGYINGQGGIGGPTATQEKTSQIIPIDIDHTYRFKVKNLASAGDSWLAIGFWNASNVFKNRTNATVTTVDGYSVAEIDIKPRDLGSNLLDATYMRVSFRTYGEPLNATTYDITDMGKTITDTIVDITDGKGSYQSKGRRIDVSRHSYDVVNMPFTPPEPDGDKLLQGMAISNGVIFQGRSNGAIDLYNLSSGEFIENLAVNGGHCSNLSFSDIYPDGNDTHPYLYVTSYNENKTFAYSVTNSAFTLVKTYLLPTDKGGYMQETCISKLDNTLWCIGYKANSAQGEAYIVSQWDLTDLTDNGDGTYTPKCLQSFEMPFIPYLQSIQYLNGQLFIVTGVDSGALPEYLTRIWVVDLGDRSIKAVMEDFPTALKNAEAEGIDFVFDESTNKYYMLICTRRSPAYYKATF